MDRFRLSVCLGAALFFGALSSVAIMEPAQAQITGNGKCPSAGPSDGLVGALIDPNVATTADIRAIAQSCEAAATGNMRPDQTARPALYASISFARLARDGVDASTNFCKAKALAADAAARSGSLATAKGRRGREASDTALWSPFARGLALWGLSTVAAPTCAEGKDSTGLRQDAAASLSQLPPPEHVAFTEFLYQRAQVYRAMGDTPREMADYATIRSAGANRAHYGAAVIALLQSSQAGCGKIASASLSEVRNLLNDMLLDRGSNGLVGSGCIGRAYLKLGQLGTDPSQRRTDFSNAITELANSAAAGDVHTRGQAHLGLAQLLATSNSVEADGHKQAALTDLNAARQSDPRNGAILLDIARVQLLSGAPDADVNGSFATAVSLLTDKETGAREWIAFRQARSYRVPEIDRDIGPYLSGAGNIPELAVARALATVLSGSSVPNEVTLQDIGENSRYSQKVRSDAYLVAAASALRRGDAVKARFFADGAVNAGGQPSDQYRAASCLAHIKADLAERDGWDRPMALCGGDSAEEHLLNGMYRLARLRLTAQNSPAENEQSAAARAAFSAGSALVTRLGDARPTFSLLLEPGSALTVGQLLKYGATKTVLCMNQDAPSGLTASQYAAAERFFSRFGAVCS